MSIQIYSKPEYAVDPSRLPDVEVFFACGEDDLTTDLGLAKGWYWWQCSPGCLPEGEAHGPFKTSSVAIRDARKVEE